MIDTKVDEQQVPKAYLWTKSDNQSHFFKLDGTIWLEREDNGSICATFEEIQIEFEAKEEHVLLFDKSRAMFVKLTDNKALRGTTKFKIDKEFADGKWFEHPNELSAVALEIAWKKEASNEHFFKSKDETWFEKKDGAVVATLRQVSKGIFDVTLYDDERQIFFKLTPNECLNGPKWNQIDQLVCTGAWMEIL